MAEKTYKCLNPVGTSMPVKTFPLAPRLDTIDGKTIHICITGEPDIALPLEKQLREKYTKVNWTQRKSYTPTPVYLSEEELKTTDAMILAVTW